MITFRCDKCDAEECSSHHDKNNGEVVPIDWLTLLEVTVINELPSPSTIYRGKATLHFCSKKCFVDYFFQNQQDIELT